MIKKITWLIVIRIVLVTSFLSIGAFIFKIDKVFFYFIIATVYFLSILYLFWLSQRRALALLGVIQLIIDCILISAIVLYTGSIDSIFTTLYLLTILSASIVVSPLMGMIITGVASFLYLGQLGLAFCKLVPFIEIRPWSKDILLSIYTAHVHITTILLVGILSSILARKIYQMEERVKEKERLSLMGELAAQIAHEIRNPLTTISGSIELLEEELKSKIDPKDINLMKAIVTESERVSAVFEQFLDFSKLDKMSFSKIVLQDILDEIDLLLRNSSALENITVQRYLDDENIAFEGDRNRIKQVFWNIIRNALEAMPYGGMLTIRGYVQEQNVCIEFVDSGLGIDKKQQKTIFTPFESSKNGGMGLGLVIAHKIVDKHGGGITVTSEKNKGSTFVIMIPRKRVIE